MQAQRFWASHMANPVLHVSLGGRTFHQILAEAGVHDKSSLKRYMLSQRKLLQRCNWLKALNEAHVNTGKHVCGAPLAIRSSCARCGESGRMRHIKTWYTARCVRVLHEFDFRSISEVFKSQCSLLEQLLALGQRFNSSRTS
eukprot:4001021-Amphidinium_carterae.1